MKKIKNIAIIAHVDHGKTTLVDAMLKQSGLFRENQHVEVCIMDSNDLERERGITIFSKNASIHYKGFKINIVDTPGHADFGGEVQRIMKMVDSVLLLVDAFEGPMPQTKYVLKKSLEIGLKPIVVINKIDRPNSRPTQVLDMVFDLFIQLQASDEQLDFPVVFASARDGYATLDIKAQSNNIFPLLDTIISHVEDTSGDPEKPLQFLASAIEYDNYVGRLGTGKIYNGTIRRGDEVLLLKKDGTSQPYRVTKIFSYEGLKKTEIVSASAGDIVSLAGIEGIDIGETVADPDNPEALPVISIDAPTLAMTFLPNNSPFLGRDGKYVTSTAVWERLLREKQNNVSLVIEKSENADSFTARFST